MKSKFFAGLALVVAVMVSGCDNNPNGYYDDGPVVYNTPPVFYHTNTIVRPHTPNVIIVNGHQRRVSPTVYRQYSYTPKTVRVPVPSSSRTVDNATPRNQRYFTPRNSSSDSTPSVSISPSPSSYRSSPSSSYSSSYRSSPSSSSYSSSYRSSPSSSSSSSYRSSPSSSSSSYSSSSRSTSSYSSRR